MNIIPKVTGHAIKTLLLYIAFVSVLLYSLFFFSINYTVLIFKITVFIHAQIYLSCSPPRPLFRCQS